MANVKYTPRLQEKYKKEVISALAKKFGPRIGQGKRPNMHFCYWTFVESATL